MSEHEVREDQHDALPECEESQKAAQNEMKEFLRIKKNKACLLQHLVKLAQRIELCWERDEKLRLWLLDTYRDCLLQLQNSKDEDLLVCDSYFMHLCIHSSFFFSVLTLFANLRTSGAFTTGLQNEEKY